MLCDEIRRMLNELDGMESEMSDQSKSQTQRSTAAQQAQELAVKIRRHRETHAGCDYKPNAN